MNIRAASAADAKLIAEVHVASWQYAYRDLLPQEFLAGLSVVQREAMWATSLVKKEPSLLVAEVNNKVVGFSAFGPCRDDGSHPTDYEIWAIYLAPSHWSTGIGRQSWLRSREAMVGQGATRISLWAIVGNQRAARFYTAAGFRPESRSSKPFELGGVQLQEIRYVLQHGG